MLIGLVRLAHCLQCEAETRSSVFRRYKRPLQLRLTQGLQYFSGYTLEMRFFFKYF